MTLEKLKLVLQEKTRFITRLLSILETFHPTMTQLPLGAWDAISKGDYVPPHAHLMMVLEATKRWHRVGRGWMNKEDHLIPLWWVWGVPVQSIIWDTTKVIALLERTAEKHQELATDEDWLKMVQDA